MIDHHTALIYTMVLISASDSEMTDAEMGAIGETVKFLPIFRDFDLARLPDVATDCAELLNDAKGLDRTLEAIEKGLPERLRETAYALACEIAAADNEVTQEESRLLEMLRYRLNVGRLPAAAIERCVRARYTTI